MGNLEFRIYASLVVGIIGIALTFARRYNNRQDVNAGLGVAGWTIFTVFLLLIL